MSHFTQHQQAQDAEAPTHGGLVLTLLSLAQFIAILDVSVVNVALPDIGRSLSLGAETLPWVITAYTVTFGGLLIVGGRIGDLIGRRLSFQIGLALFTAASLAAGLSHNGDLLLAMRAGQGIGAALLSPAALSILTTEFTGAARSRALGVWAAIGAAGAAVGVVVGGALTSGPGWQWAFFINVPVGLFVLVAVVAVVPAPPRSPVNGLDLPGAVVGTGAVALLIYGLLRAGDKGWTTAGALLPIAVSVLLAIVFAVLENRSSAPLVPPFLIRRPPLPGAVGLMVFAAAALLGTYFLTSVYLQRAEGYSPLHTGLIFLPIAFTTGIGAHFAGGHVRSIGPRPIALSGLLIAAVGLGVMAWPGVGGGVLTSLLPGFLLVGLGIGAVFVTATASGLSSVDPEHAGVTSGTFNTGHELGASLGIAVVSAIAASSFAAGPGGSTAGYAHAYAAVGVAAVVLGFAALLLLPKGPLDLGDGPMLMH